MPLLSDRILAATDFSSDAGYAVHRAAVLASQHGVALELLHVVSRPSLEAVRAWVRTPVDAAERLVQDARRLLDESAASLETTAAARVVVGAVLDELLASSAGASMLAIGAHGLNPLRDAILGTTAERLVARTRCPLLVVRRPAQSPYQRVVVAIDLLAGSETALAAALQLAPAARMSAAHAYDVPFEGMLQRAGVPIAQIDQHRAEAFQQAVCAIRTLSAQVSGDAERFLPMVERRDAACFILDCEQALDADLIVIGKRRRAAAEALLLGSITRHLLADAKADVLVLPLDLDAGDARAAPN